MAFREPPVNTAYVASSICFLQVIENRKTSRLFRSDWPHDGRSYARGGYQVGIGRNAASKK